MSRRLLFKAKRADNDEWVKRLLMQDIYYDIMHISNYTNYTIESWLFKKKLVKYEVKPETLCQYIDFL